MTRHPLLLVRTAALAFAAALLLGVPGAARAQQEPQPPPPATTDPAAQPPAGQDQANDTPRPRPRFRIGPEIGVFLPTSNETKNTFGDSWTTFGIGLGSITTPPGGPGQIVLDLDVYYKKRGQNRVTMIPISLEYRKSLGRAPAIGEDGQPVDPRQPGRGLTPYVGVAGSLVLADLRVPSQNIGSGFRATVGGSALLGTTISDDAYLEARYLAVGRVRGYDLSGLNLTAGFRF